MKNSSYYVKMALALGVSVIVSCVVTEVFFPYRTPELRPHIPLYLAETVTQFVKNGAGEAKNIITLIRLPAIPMFPRISLPDVSKTTTTPPSLSSADTPSAATVAKYRLRNTPQSVLSQGVYQQSDSLAILYTVRQAELGWGSKAYTVNGQTIEVLYAAGETPPSQEFVELCTK